MVQAKVRRLPVSPLAARLAGDEGGTVAIIFALVALPLMGVLAAAIDYGRATHVQATLQNAADAAAGSAIRLAGAETDTIRASFNANFRANLPAELKETPYRLTIDQDRGTVEARVETKVPTSLLGLMGVSALDVSASASGRLTTLRDSGRDSGGRGGPPRPTQPPDSPSGLRSRTPAANPPELSAKADQKLRAMGYDLSDPGMRRRAAEAEARMRELIARHPELLRRR